jgi:hypothetical protein
MLATDSRPTAIAEKDFNPPLKRVEAAVPGYWTLDEIISELGCSLRKVQYDITGRPEKRREPILKAYKAGSNFIVADCDALVYIKNQRK